MTERTTRRRMDEVHLGALRIAVLDRSHRALDIEPPPCVQDELQPNAVLVDGPELDLRVRGGARDRAEERADLFLKASCWAASACTWGVRGLRRLPSSLTK